MRIAGLALGAAFVVWFVAALAVAVATTALVDESGWSELPVFAWIMVAIVFVMAPLGLLYGGYRWRTASEKHD